MCSTVPETTSPTLTAGVVTAFSSAMCRSTLHL